MTIARRGRRPAILATAGIVLALVTATVAAALTTGTNHPAALERRGTTRRDGGRLLPPGPDPGHHASVSEVLLEPNLLKALATGKEPVDPRDTVGSAIVTGRLLFIGASYSVGLGATGKALSFPSLLAGQYHEHFSVSAVSGTGFQNPGPRHQGTFAERMLAVPNTPAPRIVLIQGGRDDYRYPLNQEYQAVVDTIQLAQRRFDEAQIVLLGPIPARLPLSAHMLQLCDEIQRGAAAAHAGYINAVGEDWITPANVHLYAGRIPGHPNDAGYAYITSRLRQELPAALTTARAPIEPDGT